MKRMLKRVFQILGVDQSTDSCSESDLPAVLEAAKLMSLHGCNRDTIIVVVEMGSEFDVQSGAYVRRQYLYYPFREATDYRRIVCLKAAFWNGRRIDTELAAMDIGSESSPNPPDERDAGDQPTLVWSRRGHWVEPKDKIGMQSR